MSLMGVDERCSTLNVADLSTIKGFFLRLGCSDISPASWFQASRRLVARLHNWQVGEQPELVREHTLEAGKDIRKSRDQEYGLSA